MRFFLVLIFLLGPVQAQRTLTKDTFLINVRPVLNGILSEFYEMVTLFPDFPKELIPLIQELDAVTSDREILRDSCPRIITADCSEVVGTLRKRLAKLRGLSLGVLNSLKMTSSLHLNSLSGQKLLIEFDSDLEQVKGELDNSSFFLSAEIAHRTETYRILKQLDELNTMISLALVEYIPFEYREDFRHFYFNFVHPIQLQISKNKNYEFLNRNVNSLNFAINLLNMNLTKRNKKTPEGMAPYLSIIHNRWNGLLRYYF